MHSLRVIVIGSVFGGVLAGFALAGDSPGVEIVASKDATLYEESSGFLANGAGEHVFSGLTNQTSTLNGRRGLFEFDIASSVPAGATIASAQLRIVVNKADRSGAETFTLHRVTTEWEEGATDAFGEEGTGEPAAPGSATWIHAVSPDVHWDTPGGDFEAMSSANLTLDDERAYTFGSTPGMVADVQSWLDDPSANHGWLLLGPEPEPGPATVKRITSRDSAATSEHPALIVTFEESGVCLGDCDDSGAVDFNDLVAMLFEFGTGPGDGCDADENGNVDFNDLVAALFLFGPCP